MPSLFHFVHEQARAGKVMACPRSQSSHCKPKQVSPLLRTPTLGSVSSGFMRPKLLR